MQLPSNDQELQFHSATDIWWSRMAISHCYWHLVGQEWQFDSATEIQVDQELQFYIVLLTSGGQEWQLAKWQIHIPTDI